MAQTAVAVAAAQVAIPSHQTRQRVEAAMHTHQRLTPADLCAEMVQEPKSCLGWKPAALEAQNQTGPVNAPAAAGIQGGRASDGAACARI